MAGVIAANRSLLRFKDKTDTLCCCLLDFEPTWRRYASPLEKIFRTVSPNTTVISERCDVTVSLGMEINKEAICPIAEGDLHIFSYVAHETSKASKANDWIFYREFIQRVKPGTMVLFLDVMTHSRVVFEEVHQAMVQASVSRADGALVRLHAIPIEWQAELRSELMLIELLR